MLTHWDPFTEMNRLHDQLFSRRESGGSAEFRPAVDIREEAGAFVVHAELPGVKADDIHLDVEKNVLTLRGERKLERKEEDEEAGWRRIERSYGSFSRSFALPETVDTDAIEASLNDGVLDLRIPKREAPTPKRIAVKTS